MVQHVGRHTWDLLLVDQTGLWAREEFARGVGREACRRLGCASRGVGRARMARWMNAATTGTPRMASAGPSSCGDGVYFPPYSASEHDRRGLAPTFVFDGGGAMDAEALVAPVVEASGLELVEVTFRREAGRKVLRVVVDREGGVDIDTISATAEQVSRRLDLEGFAPGPYALEVSSPGIERRPAATSSSTRPIRRRSARARSTCSRSRSTRRARSRSSPPPRRRRTRTRGSAS